MEKTLEILNELEKSKLISKYAIGGAIAVLFHAEPVLTYDMDVYCFLPKPTSSLVTLSPIYDFLKARGYPEDREHVLIEGVPVQFIPAYNPLVIEAVSEAKRVKFKSVKTRVVRAEHLVAIMLQTNRAKDRARIPQMLSQARIDQRRLNAIIKRHGLTDAWRRAKQGTNDN